MPRADARSCRQAVRANRAPAPSGPDALQNLESSQDLGNGSVTTHGVTGVWVRGTNVASQIRAVGGEGVTLGAASHLRQSKGAFKKARGQ
jgi:hypothetical protein